MDRDRHEAIRATTTRILSQLITTQRHKKGLYHKSLIALFGQVKQSKAFRKACLNAIWAT